MPKRLSQPLAAILLLTLAACAPPADEAADDATAGGETATAESSPAPPPEDPFAAAFAGPIEEAQGRTAWSAKQAVAADLVLRFGGNQVLDATLTFTPDTRGSLLELGGGTEAGGPAAGWNGSTAWVSPADAELPRARFHVLTWPYFLAVPFKLRDPGAHLEDLGAAELQGETYDAARLTFDPGTGDTPDDWYVVYRDRQTDRLAALAYIVTYGTTQEEAEQEPHAITYHDFQTVDGVTLPTRWRFWLWSEAEGIHGDPIGEAELADLRFVEPAEGAFEMPADAREEGLPAAGGE